MSETEYNKCVDLYADRVYRFILKNTKQEADARDVVQNAFTKLWLKHQEVNFEKARPYLFTTAYRDMIDQIRKVKRIQSTDSIPETAKINEGNETTTDLQDLLHKGLERLNEVQRSIILLRDYEGYSYKEIADMIELSETQVKVYLFRARKKLKQFLVSIDHIL